MIGKAGLPFAGNLGLWCTSSGSPWFYKPEVALKQFNQAITHMSASFPQRYEVTTDQWYFEHMFLDMIKVTPVSLRVHVNISTIF